MSGDVDDGLARLATYRSHPGLEGMEARVLTGIARAGERRSVMRGAAVVAAGALALGLASGAFVPADTGAASLDPISGAATLAPSVLLLGAG